MFSYSKRLNVSQIDDSMAFSYNFSVGQMVQFFYDRIENILENGKHSSPTISFSGNVFNRFLAKVEKSPCAVN